MIILLHQLLFQGMFVVKNIALSRKLGEPIRGSNREANLSIVLFALFIALSIVFGLLVSAPGSVQLFSEDSTLIITGLLLAASLLIGGASLWDLGDSWRVGVIEEQKTALVQSGIYRFTRNPYFVAYLLMLGGYTVLLQNWILLVLLLVGFGVVHAMILKEERYLAGVHGDSYLNYRRRVPRYLFL